MKKTLHLAIVLSALICSVASFGKTYTLIMLDNGKNSDGYTAIGNYPDSVLSSGVEYVTSVANENVYLGKTGFGLKLGAGSKAGSIVTE